MSLKTSDPLATPIAALAGVRPASQESLPSMSTKREMPLVEKPNYQTILAQMASEPPPPPPVYEDDIFPADPPPRAIPPRFAETMAPSREPYPPSRSIAPPQAAPPPPPATAAAPPVVSSEKPGIVEANKNLIVLFVIAAAVLKFAAPRLRAYPRFVSNTELGLNLVGVAAVSILIVSIYKLVTHMANLKS
jgi:hypothetical protein